MPTPTTTDRDVLELRAELAQRLRPYCTGFTPGDFDRLIDRMVWIQVKYERQWTRLASNQR